MTQKVAIITGGSQGIGAGLVAGCRRSAEARQLSDVVDGILFLQAAPYITGEILHLDGGQSAGHYGSAGGLAGQVDRPGPGAARGGSRYRAW